MKAVAILAETHSHAARYVDALKKGGVLLSYSRPEHRGEAIFVGVPRPFFVVSDAVPDSDQRLRGAELAGFICTGFVTPSLQDLARAQVRD